MGLVGGLWLGRWMRRGRANIVGSISTQHIGEESMYYFTYIHKYRQDRQNECFVVKTGCGVLRYRALAFIFIFTKWRNCSGSCTCSL